MWLVVKTERRWQPRAGAAVRCRNTSDRRKRRVNYEKISLLIVCLFAKFPRQRRVNYTSCMSFCKILRHPLTNRFATEHQEVLLQSMFWWSCAKS